MLRQSPRDRLVSSGSQRGLWLQLVNGEGKQPSPILKSPGGGWVCPWALQSSAALCCALG